MKVVTLLQQNILIIRLEGELDVCGANDFRAAIDSALAETGAKHIILNMKKVSFIDSSGLGVILGRYKHLTHLGGKLCVVQLAPNSKRLFELAGLTKLLTICQSEEQALALL